MPVLHVPVLRGAVVRLLAPAAPGLLVDATVGMAGHAAALLEAAPGLRLLGIDRDPAAIELARERLGGFGERVRLVCAPFSRLPEVLAGAGEAPAAILADLGCSSLQLDTAERGFSFRHDAPLDMRMGRDGPTAAELLADLPAEELMRILWDYGEERRARAIARAIVERRERSPIETTGDLVELVVSVLGPDRAAEVEANPRSRSARLRAVERIGGTP